MVWYDLNYYSYSPIDDPQGPTERRGAYIGRGGNWKLDRRSGRFSMRLIYGVGTSHAALGFRVVRTIEVPTAQHMSPVAHAPGSLKQAPPPAVAPFDAAQARQFQETWAAHLETAVETTNSIGATMDDPLRDGAKRLLHEVSGVLVAEARAPAPIRNKRTIDVYKPTPRLGIAQPHTFEQRV